MRGFYMLVVGRTLLLDRHFVCWNAFLCVSQVGPKWQTRDRSTNDVHQLLG